MARRGKRHRLGSFERSGGDASLGLVHDVLGDTVGRALIKTGGESETWVIDTRSGPRSMTRG